MFFRYFTSLCRFDERACSKNPTWPFETRILLGFVERRILAIALVPGSLRTFDVVCVSPRSPFVVLARTKVGPLLLLSVSVFVDDCGWCCSTK